MYTTEEIERIRAKKRADTEALNAKREAQSKNRYVGNVDPMGVQLTRSGNTIGNVVSQLSNSMELFFVSQNNMLEEGDSIEIRIIREK